MQTSGRVNVALLNVLVDAAQEIEVPAKTPDARKTKKAILRASARLNKLKL